MLTTVHNYTIIPVHQFDFELQRVHKHENCTKTWESLTDIFERIKGPPNIQGVPKTCY